MFELLDPLHAQLEKGATTLKEQSFKQVGLYCFLIDKYLPYKNIFLIHNAAFLDLR